MPISRFGMLHRCAGLLVASVAFSSWSADPFPGKPPITPRWAFEPWVWEDVTNTRSSVENLVKGYLDRNIPVGAVIIDSPWETCYNSLTWDTTRYPQPAEMIAGFHAKNIKVLAWITGWVNKYADDRGENGGSTTVPNSDYDTVKTRGYAVNNGADGNWWKSTAGALHIDFTNAAALSWWHGRVDKVLAVGIDGWKVDQGADYLGDQVVTSNGTISKDDFKKYFYADFYDYTVSKNPAGLTVARANSHQGGIGASVSKSPISWQGDFGGGFSGIADQVGNIYSSAQSGYCAPGVEVGGYFNENPTKNSLIRYAQFGALTPLMENGGRNGGLQEHLPWFWDTTTTSIYRFFATLHSELSPYFFSYGVEAHLTGTSILRNTDIGKAHHSIGNEIFVSVITSDVTSKTVQFPAGSSWIDFNNESKMYVGGVSLPYQAPLNKYPVFLRAGAIIPLHVKSNQVGHGDGASAGKTTVLIYPSGQSTLAFHRPTGDGVEYSDVTISANESTGTFTLSGVMTHSYILRIKSFAAPTAVSGADSWSYDQARKFIIAQKSQSAFTIAITGLKGYSASTEGIEGAKQPDRRGALDYHIDRRGLALSNLDDNAVVSLYTIRGSLVQRSMAGNRSDNLKESSATNRIRPPAAGEYFVRVKRQGETAQTIRTGAMYY